MATLQSSVSWAQAYVQGLPITNFGLAPNYGEPALTVCNMIVSTILGPPFQWNWNRQLDSSIVTIAGIQDYQADLYEFGYLEKASLTDPTGKIWQIPDVKNNEPLTKSTQQARPDVICALVDNTETGVPSTYVTIRFSAVPEQIYTANLVYQMAPANFTSLTQDWGIPNNLNYIYNNLFLGEILAAADDQRSQLYRARGVASLLARQSGLSEMQKSVFAEAYIHENVGLSIAALRAQQSIQARGV